MAETKLPKSCEEHQPKYHNLAWMQYTLAELGQWVHLFVKRAGHRKDTVKREKDLTDAQNYLDMMQAHIDAVKGSAVIESTNNIVPAPAPEPEPERRGPIRDDQGNVTRISVLISERGYDPDAHENKELKIFCDGVHILTAHTADTVEGLVRYYDKNARGRIKTLERRGKVEIRGI